MSSEGPIVPCVVHIPTMHGSFSGKVSSETNMVYLPKIHDYNQNVTASTPNLDLQKKERANSLQRFFSSIMGKGRRKNEKDAPSPNPDEQREYLVDDYIKDKISDCDLNNLVTLPVGLDYNEWLATHTISFYEHVNLMYGTVTQFCTKTGCSSMTGPANTQYLYVDEKNKKCKHSAPDYVNLVMSDCQKSITDENVFPTKYGNVFPAAFESVVRRIHRHLFHVIAHIYHAHFKEIAHLKLHPHLNTLFQHFMTFNRTYKTLEEKETEVLDELFVKLEGVIVSHKVPPSSPTPSTGSRSPTKSRPSNDIANNGAVITCEDSSSSVPVEGGPAAHVTPTSASSHGGDTGSGAAAVEEHQQRTNSAQSSPNKCVENHSSGSAQPANTNVPDARDGGGSTPQGGGSTPLSSSPSKYPACDVTTRQPQAQPQDPNLMPSILSS